MLIGALPLPVSARDAAKSTFCLNLDSAWPRGARSSEQPHAAKNNTQTAPPWYWQRPLLLNTNRNLGPRKIVFAGPTRRELFDHVSNQLEQMELPNQGDDLGRQTLHKACWNPPIRTPRSPSLPRPSHQATPGHRTPQGLRSQQRPRRCINVDMDL